MFAWIVKRRFFHIAGKFVGCVRQVFVFCVVVLCIKRLSPSKIVPEAAEEIFRNVIMAVPKADQLIVGEDEEEEEGEEKSEAPPAPSGEKKVAGLPLRIMGYKPYSYALEKKHEARMSSCGGKLAAKPKLGLSAEECTQSVWGVGGPCGIG